MTGSPPTLPPDGALPVATALLHLDEAETLLRERLDLRGPFERVRIRYLAYRPGVHVTVQYELRGAHGVVDAGVVADRTSVHAFAYPHDPALGALADPAAVMRRLGLPEAPVTRLAWVPGQRAALACGDAVLKLYADHAALGAAVMALAHVGDALPTARRLGVDPAGRSVAQQRLPGRTLGLDDAVGRGADAGALVRRLRDAVGTDGLPVMGPAEALAQADDPVALASFARPDLADRLAAVRARLAGALPAAGPLVAAHGDYNVGQLLDTGDGLAVIDLDTLCAAPAAFDVAAFATNVVSGREGDVERAERALTEVVRGAGGEPEALAWYVAVTLLRRVDRAVRRLKRDWPERTAALVGAVERAAAAVG